MDRAVRFYRDTLGLVPSYESPWWTQFSIGSLQLGLHGPLEGSRPPYGIKGKGWILGLASDDLNRVKSAVEQSEGSVTEGYHEVPNGVVLTIADPDGNPIQLIQEGASLSDFD